MPICSPLHPKASQYKVGTLLPAERKSCRILQSEAAPVQFQISLSLKPAAVTSCLPPPTPDTAGPAERRNWEGWSDFLLLFPSYPNLNFQSLAASLSPPFPDPCRTCPPSPQGRVGGCPVMIRFTLEQTFCLLPSPSADQVAGPLPAASGRRSRAQPCPVLAVRPWTNPFWYQFPHLQNRDVTSPNGWDQEVRK